MCKLHDNFIFNANKPCDHRRNTSKRIFDPQTISRISFNSCSSVSWDDVEAQAASSILSNSLYIKIFANLYLSLLGQTTMFNHTELFTLYYCQFDNSDDQTRLNCLPRIFATPKQPNEWFQTKKHTNWKQTIRK